MDGELKLEIELVPRTAWWSNVRSILLRRDWDALRQRVYREYGHRCAICGADGMIHCHECWSYDDINLVQTLTGFVALCPLCHHVKHLGHAGILAQEGKLDYDSVISHFLEVNGCSREVFEKHRETAFALWSERSRHQWKLAIALGLDVPRRLREIAETGAR